MMRPIAAMLCLILLFTIAFAEDTDSDAAFLVIDSDDEDFVEFPELEPDVDLVLTFGGDAVLGTREAWWNRNDAFPGVIETMGYAYPFSELQSVFTADDMTMVNLECVLKESRTGEMTTKLYRFRGLPEYTEILKQSSIEQVNIANNHYIDYRTAGRDATRAALDAATIPYSGYTYTFVWEKNDIRIGFGGCRETVWKQDKSIIANEVAQLREAGCEVVIYSCHWGKEYSTQHNDTQMEMAQAAADAGVDIIIGTHPHVVQGVDTIDDMLVLWSLGNLMFGGTINLPTYDATLAQLTLHFNKGSYKGCDLTLMPILTSGKAAEKKNDYCPILATGEDRARILQKIQQDSSIKLTETMFFPAR